MHTLFKYFVHFRCQFFSILNNSPCKKLFLLIILHSRVLEIITDLKNTNLFRLIKYIALLFYRFSNIMPGNILSFLFCQFNRWRIILYCIISISFFILRFIIFSFEYAICISSVCCTVFFFGSFLFYKSDNDKEQTD